MKLYLVRHGETDYNKAGIVQGQYDTYLNKTGENQSLCCAQRLHDIDIDAIYTSDLIRASTTAGHIHILHADISLLQDERLREGNLGKYNGVSKSDIKEEFQVSTDKEMYLILSTYPGVELNEAIYRRCFLFVKDIYEKHPTGTIVVVAHAGSIEVLLHIFDTRPQQIFPIPYRKTSNAGISLIYIEDEIAEIIYENDTSHL